MGDAIAFVLRGGQDASGSKEHSKQAVQQTRPTEWRRMCWRLRKLRDSDAWASSGRGREGFASRFPRRLYRTDGSARIDRQRAQGQAKDKTCVRSRPQRAGTREEGADSGAIEGIAESRARS